MADASATTRTDLSPLRRRTLETWCEAGRRGGWELAVMTARGARVAEALAMAGRIHLGSESCAALLPGPGELERLVPLVEAQGALTVVTPFLGEGELDGFLRWFDGLRALTSCRFEVVVNDWGILRVLRRDHGDLEPVLGRHLVPQLRDSGLAAWEAEFGPRLPPGFLASLAEPFMPPSCWSPFLDAHGLRRIELSALAVPLRPPPVDGLRCSLHAPLIPLAASRYCGLATAAEGAGAPVPTIGPCRSRPCRSGPLVLRDGKGEVLVLRGRTLCLPFRQLPPRRGGLDRLVLDLDAFHDLTFPEEGSLACASS